MRPERPGAAPFGRQPQPPAPFTRQAAGAQDGQAERSLTRNSGRRHTKRHRTETRATQAAACPSTAAKHFGRPKSFGQDRNNALGPASAPAQLLRRNTHSHTIVARRQKDHLGRTLNLFDLGAGLRAGRRRRICSCELSDRFGVGRRRSSKSRQVARMQNLHFTLGLLSFPLLAAVVAHEDAPPPTHLLRDHVGRPGPARINPARQSANSPASREKNCRPFDLNEANWSAAAQQHPPLAQVSGGLLGECALLARLPAATEATREN
jgi:hypothetical protein